MHGRGRALGNLAVVVASGYAAFLALLGLDALIGPRSGWFTTVVGLLVVLAWRADGARRRAEGHFPRWNGFADLGSWWESIIWGAVVALEGTVAFGLTGTGEEPWLTGAAIGGYLGVAVACFLGIIRHFHPVAGPTPPTGRRAAPR